jgi:hypothetical protein
VKKLLLLGATIASMTCLVSCDEQASRTSQQTETPSVVQSSPKVEESVSKNKDSVLTTTPIDYDISKVSIEKLGPTKDDSTIPKGSMNVSYKLYFKVLAGSDTQTFAQEVSMYDFVDGINPKEGKKGLEDYAVLSKKKAEDFTLTISYLQGDGRWHSRLEKIETKEFWKKSNGKSAFMPGAVYYQEKWH